MDLIVEALENWLQHVEARVTADMNMELQKEFTKLEVEEALNQMVPLKSSSPDGFETYFYQSYWTLVGDEVSTIVFKFLKGDEFVPLVNSTLIALIPKV